MEGKDGHAQAQPGPTLLWASFEPCVLALIKVVPKFKIEQGWAWTSMTYRGVQKFNPNGKSILTNVDAL